MIRKFFLFFITFTLSSFILLSQNNLDYDLEQILETLSYESSYSIDLDEIENLHRNPIYLKEANFNKLAILPGFSSSEILKIIKVASQDTITNFDKFFENINLTNEQKFLLTYCTTFKKYKLDDLRNLNYRIRNKSYLINPEALSEGKFVGNSIDLYNRISVNFDAFHFNLLIDKDFGEKSFADFKTGSLKFDKNNFKLILGDYVINSGMGNILWKPFSLRKGADVISPAIQYNNDIIDYKSSMDYYFKRGVAAQYSFEIKPDQDFIIMSWYSDKKISGRIDSNIVYGNDFISEYASSIYKTGYFRTTSEISKLDNLQEKIFGFSTILDQPDYNVGFTFNRLQYDKFIYTKSSEDILGKNQSFYSLFGQINIYNSILSGEFSLDDYRNSAIKVALNKIFDSFEYVIGLRNFHSNFKSPFGMTYGEKSNPNNETGLYTGIRYFPFNNLTISSYIDLYSSNDDIDKFYGNDFLTQLDWNIKRNTKLIVRLNYENKTTYKDNNATNRQNFKFRLNLDYKLTKNLNSRIRAENNFYFGEVKESGNLLRFDLKYNFEENYNLGISYSIFKGDSYNVAIWQYEMPVNGYMTTIPLYGEGMRSTIWFQANFLDFLNFKIASIIYIKNNVDYMGSGLLEIKGNKDMRIISQLELRF